MKKELTCISCPIGCLMAAEIREDGSMIVTGNKCARGTQYAKDELLDPRRVVTATCRTDSPFHPRLPVKSGEPCPKNMIHTLLDEIYALTVHIPIRAGDIVAELEGVKIVATRTVIE